MKTEDIKNIGDMIKYFEQTGNLIAISLHYSPLQIVGWSIKLTMYSHPEINNELLLIDTCGLSEEEIIMTTLWEYERKIESSDKNTIRVEVHKKRSSSNVQIEINKGIEECQDNSGHRDIAPE